MKLKEGYELDPTRIDFPSFQYLDVVSVHFLLSPLMSEMGRNNIGAGITVLTTKPTSKSSENTSEGPPFWEMRLHAPFPPLLKGPLGSTHVYSWHSFRFVPGDVCVPCSLISSTQLQPTNVSGVHSLKIIVNFTSMFW